MCKYELNFEELSEVFPPNPCSESGIYCIFAASPSYDSLNLKKLIYIGKAEDMKERFDDHEKIGDWKDKADNMKLYCSIAWLFGIGRKNLLRLEHEMIFMYQPIVNIKCKDSPPDNRPNIKVTGPIEYFPVINP